MLLFAIACGSSPSDDAVDSQSADPTSASAAAATESEATMTDVDPESSSTADAPGDDASVTETTSSGDADAASSSSSSSEGASMPGTAATYEACTTDDDCAAPDEVCLAVHPLAKPQCRPPCAPDGWCDPDPSVGSIMFGACSDDGYCMVYCTPFVPCVAPFVCALYEGGQDGACSPP